MIYVFLKQIEIQYRKNYKKRVKKEQFLLVKDNREYFEKYLTL